MAKYHPRLINELWPRICLCAGILALTFACSHPHAQQPPPTPETTADTFSLTAGPSESPTDEVNAAPAIPARQRLASEARRLLAEIDGPPSPVWINANGEDVLGFWQEDMSGTPVGAVLMLHAQGQTPRWPETLLNLHQVLPRFGWATLSVELPAPAPLAVPARVNGTAADTPPAQSIEEDGAAEAEQTGKAEQEPEKPEPATDETQLVFQETEVNAAVAVEETAAAVSAEDVEQAAMAAIQAAFDYLQQQNQYNIVILGEGLGAARALNFAKSATLGKPQAQEKNGAIANAVVDRPIRGIVMLDAAMAEGSQHAPELLLIYPEIPTLDLITTADFDVRQSAVRRKQVSKKMQYQIYVARRIMPQSGVTKRDKENDITKSVRGFIGRHAKGVEL